MMAIRVLREKWAKLAATSSVGGFVDTLLRTYGQIVFSNNPVTGLLLLVGLWDNPASAIFSLIGAVSALATAKVTRTHPALVKSWLFGCNGAATGLAFALYFPLNVPATLLLIACSMIAALLTKVLIDAMSIKLNLPILSIPFLAAVWGGLLLSRLAPDVFGVAADWARFLPGGRIDQMLQPILPEAFSNLLRTLSAILLQNSIYLGIFCLLGIVTYSRVSTIFGFAGGAMGAALYNVLAAGGGNYYGQLTAGFNCALIGIVLGGILVRLTWQAILLTLVAVLAGAEVSIVLLNVLGSVQIPPLAAPFTLVTIFALYALRAAPAASLRAGLEPVPLTRVERPEASFEWRALWARPVRQKTELSLPFYGMWYVSRGNHTRPTHSGNGAYAWDFLVLDHNGNLCRGSGTDNEDYYTFSLPVLAPAEGRVVKVTNSVRDNNPPNTNWEQSWGNCVVIDHGNSEFSEISHLRQHSIVVKEGDRVVRGQLLGYCGNSGLSMSPHIHYQLQHGSSLGAHTVPARFHNYVVLKGPRKLMVREGVPRGGEFVSNATSS